MVNKHAVCLLIAACVAAGCAEPKCRVGSVHRGGRCVAISSDAGSHDDAGSDAGDNGPYDGGNFCLLDSDHDGYGVEGVGGDCPADAGDVKVGDCDDGDPNAYPGAPIDRCDGHDNDCDGKDEKPVAEVCNGLDDDCKDGVDNDVANACGMCGELPADTCNWKDDDCNGAGDVDLVNKLATDAAERVFTQPGASGAGAVALVERTGGGAWLLYNAGGITSGNDVHARGLDAAGVVNAMPTTNHSLGTEGFAADSDGKWVALLERKRPVGADPKGDSTWLRLQLFAASDMSFLGETLLVTHEDIDGQQGEYNDADDCDFVQPLDVSVFEDAEGTVHLAAVYIDTVGASGAPSCSGVSATYLQVATYTTAIGWSVQTRSQMAAQKAPGTMLERVPCRDEWLLVQAVATNTTIGRYSTKGELLADNLDTLDNVESLLGLDRGREDCANASPTLLVTFAKPVGGALHTFSRRWQVGAGTNALTRLGDDGEIPAPHPLIQLRARQSLGRWFATAWDNDSPGPKLFELRFDGDLQARKIAIVVPPGADPGPRPDDFKASDVIDVGQAIVSVFKRGTGMPEGGTSLDDWRVPGDTDDPAVAVTYAVGCP